MYWNVLELTGDYELSVAQARACSSRTYRISLRVELHCVGLHGLQQHVAAATCIAVSKTGHAANFLSRSGMRDNKTCHALECGKPEDAKCHEAKLLFVFMDCRSNLGVF